MTPLNFHYLCELDDETIELLRRSSRSPHYVNHFSLPPTAFSPDGQAYLPVLGVSRSKWNKQTPVIRIRVLTKQGGITVTLKAFDELLLERYRSLRIQLGNQTVSVTFPDITVNCSAGGYGLYFTADDFKLEEPTSQPAPFLFI